MTDAQTTALTFKQLAPDQIQVGMLVAKAGNLFQIKGLGEASSTELPARVVPVIAPQGVEPHAMILHAGTKYDVLINTETGAYTPDGQRPSDWKG